MDENVYPPMDGNGAVNNTIDNNISDILLGGQSPPKRKKFIPPTVDEVAAYCQERKNAIDPEYFVDHYEANGWRRGKTPIENWKACVRTWEKNGGKDKQSSTPDNYSDVLTYKTNGKIGEHYGKQ